MTQRRSRNVSADAADLVQFLNASPTPYHAVAEISRRLEAAGFRELDEGEVWDLAPGDRAFVVRHEGSLLAFIVGQEAPVDSGLVILAAHTDSPGLRLKPRGEDVAQGLNRLAVEPYGGVLLHTWFDRDCGLAGRVALRPRSGRESVALVDIRRPLLRVASLAIHLNREMYTEGFKPNPQEHLAPLLGLEGGPSLLALLAAALRESGAGIDGPEDILAHDLMLYDLQPAALLGAADDFLASGRLDNLASCHAALHALLGRADQARPATRVIALFDHEEVGSQTASGARGTFLRDLVSRLTGGREALRRTSAKSLLVSVDMAHGVHPSYANRHDPQHAPRLGGGPVIKWNQNQSYATDASTAARFAAACSAAGVPVQVFTSRNDVRCGSTIGPPAATGLGIRAVDVGTPMLSMHSAREMCATADVSPMIKALEETLAPQPHASS